MSTTILKLKELQQSAKDALVAAEFFASASVGVAKANPGTSDKSVVVADVGLSRSAIELHLRTRGFCLVVEPVTEGVLRSQSGSEWIMDCTLMVKVLVNPVRNSSQDEGGAGVDVYDAVNQVAKTLCRATRHPGGEFFKLKHDGQCLKLSAFDDGLLAYDMNFTKEVML